MAVSVLIALVRHGLIRFWLSLTALCAVEVASSIALYAVHSHYAWYFYLYWAAAFLKSSIKLWLLCDILQSIPGTDFISKDVRLGILIAGIIMGLGAFAYAHHGSALWVKSDILGTVLLYERCISFFSLTFCVGLLTIVFLIGLGWESPGPGIVCGLGLQLGEATLRSIFLSQGHTARILSGYLDGLTHLVVLCLWFTTLSQKAEQ
jgi:hypothetical protein